MERKILRKEVSKDVLNKIKEKYDAFEMTDEAAKKVYSLEITFPVFLWYCRRCLE